jgi:hypothetical protein
MKPFQFSISIHASRERVWKTLWEDKTYRDWANFIDEGTYMVGELKAGNEVQFISSSSGYGVTSYVESLIPNVFVKLRHMADTKDMGNQNRENEWTGGTESYSLTDADGITTLTAEMDLPPELVELFQTIFPKALERVKELAENAGDHLAGI